MSFFLFSNVCFIEAIGNVLSATDVACVLLAMLGPAITTYSLSEKKKNLIPNLLLLRPERFRLQ